MSLVLDGSSSITADERYRSSAESPNECRTPRSRIVVLPIIELTTASEWLCLIRSDDICQLDIKDLLGWDFRQSVQECAELIVVVPFTGQGVEAVWCA